MSNKITASEEIKRTKSYATKTDFRPLGYAMVGVLFGGMLTLSAMNGFLFFGWLAISSAIIFGLLTIHSIGEQQTKRN